MFNDAASYIIDNGSYSTMFLAERFNLFSSMGSGAVLSLVGITHSLIFSLKKYGKGILLETEGGIFAGGTDRRSLKHRSRMSTFTNLLRSPGICQPYTVSDGGKKCRLGKATIGQVAFLSIWIPGRMDLGHLRFLSGIPSFVTKNIKHDLCGTQQQGCSMGPRWRNRGAFVPGKI